MLHQRQTNVTPDAMLQEVVVPGKPPLSFHVRAHIRPARLHNGAQVMLTDVAVRSRGAHVRSVPCSQPCMQQPSKMIAHRARRLFHVRGFMQCGSFTVTVRRRDAEKRTRTSTGLLPLEPESSASANSAI